MWSIIAKVGGFLIAHKTEVLSAVQIWRRLRSKRKAAQKDGENPVEYYKRVGKNVLKDAAEDVVNEKG